MRRTIAGLAAAALTIALTSCAKDTSASTGQPPPDLPTSSAPSTSTPTSKTATQASPNERGAIPKKLGEKAGIGRTEGNHVATFSIDKISIDPPCDEYGTPAESGHTLVLSIRAATSSDAEAAETLGYMLNSFNFSEIGKDGVTRSAQAGSCIDYSRYLTPEFGINQKYAGEIELVVPEASGLLALSDPSLNFGGWEWSY